MTTYSHTRSIDISKTKTDQQVNSSLLFKIFSSFYFFLLLVKHVNNDGCIFFCLCLLIYLYLLLIIIIFGLFDFTASSGIMTQPRFPLDACAHQSCSASNCSRAYTQPLPICRNMWHNNHFSSVILFYDCGEPHT